MFLLGMILMWGWAHGADLVEPQIIQITKPTPYYQNGFGINTSEACEPISGKKTAMQQKASGCLYPTVSRRHESGVILQEPRKVNCNKIEYVSRGNTEYQICNFEKDRRIVVGTIQDGVYESGQPLCQPGESQVECQFFMEDGKMDIYTRPQMLSEGCVDCLVSEKAPEPPAPIPPKVQEQAQDILQVAVQAQKAEPPKAPESELVCTADYEEPTTNPDLHFFNQAKGATDTACSYKRYLDYKEKIIKAAKIFDLDENVLLCLFHRESRNTVNKKDQNGRVTKTKDYTKDWDPQAVSFTGAVGIGQFTQGTFPDVMERVKKRSNYSELWDKYFQEIGRSVPDSDKLEIVAGRNKYNVKEKCGARCDPDISIGAGIMYVRYIMDGYGNNYENKNANRTAYQANLKIKKDLERKQKIRSLTLEEQKKLNQVKGKVSAAREYMVFIAGAYNRGPGTVQRAITKGKGPIAWQNKMIENNGGKNGEVAGHIRNIRACTKKIEE